MVGKLIDVADLDCVFLTYDEPHREEFWARVRDIVPWAKRVDGVKGSDAAHKAAGLASDTDRFILIDGDNIPDADFFNQQLVLDDVNHDCVFRWKARNEINGLVYGNGGISCWTRQFVADMRTHENTDGRAETEIEFCFDPRYWAMHDCYSTTYPNQDPYHAWRAGFREGVKMCLDRGRRLDLLEFRDRVSNRNMDTLSIWHNVGVDAKHGIWAIMGARQGTVMTMLEDWDHRHVQDFDQLDALFRNEAEHKDANDYCWQLGCILNQKLGMTIVPMTSLQSSFFKHHFLARWKNQGVMTRDQ